MVDLGEDEEKFESFMSPITSEHSFCCHSEADIREQKIVRKNESRFVGHAKDLVHLF